MLGLHGHEFRNLTEGSDVDRSYGSMTTEMGKIKMLTIAMRVVHP